MKFLNFIFITIFALSTNMGYAAKITDDTLTIGRPGSSANKDLKLGTKVIRSNESTGKLEFSNDGTLYKNLGSGSGSGDTGVNVLENASFEDGLTPGWTSVGGTFTQQTYTNGIEGDTKYARHVASASGQYFESTAKIVTDSIGSSCLAYSKYKTTDNNAYKISFFSAGVEINSQQLPTTNGAWITTPYVPVLCPTAGTLIKVRFESLAAGTLEADKVYLGSDNRQVEISQAQTLGTLRISGCSSNFSTTSTSLASFGTNTSCVYSATGRVIAPATQLAGFTITNVPKGRLSIRATGHFAKSNTATNTSIGFVIRDTSNAVNGGENFAGGATGAGLVFGFPSVSGNIPSGSIRANVNFEIFGRTTAAGSPAFIDAAIPLEFEVLHFPDSSDLAVTSDQSGWQIDANIGGAQIALNNSVSSYTELSTSPSLDLVLRSGSAPARIPCAGTNPATGLTCAAGNESVGVNFTPPFTGYFDACFEFSGRQTTVGASEAYLAFQPVLTANSSQTILQEGGSRLVNNQSNDTGGNISQMTPFSNCGTFYFADTSEKTIRLMYESQNIAAAFVEASRAAGYGQPDIHVIVRPSTMNIARPVLTSDQVTTPATVRPITFSGRMTTGGVISRNKGGILATGSCSSGNYSIPFTRTLASAPNCIVGLSSANNFRFAPSQMVETATGLTFLSSRDNQTYVCGDDVIVICHGEL